MPSILKIGNRVAEHDLRHYLDTQGYFGRTAKIHRLDLVAVQRPGWKQVFECQLEAKHRDTGWQQLFGVIKDDERQKSLPEIVVTPDQQAAQQILANWTQDYILTTRQPPNPVLFMGIAGGILAAFCVLLVVLQLLQGTS